MTAAITPAERSVAAEAITCANAGNTVLIEPTSHRTAREIAQLVDLVAVQLDAEVQIVTHGSRVEIRAARR